MQSQDSVTIEIQDLSQDNLPHYAVWLRILAYDQERWSKSKHDGNLNAKIVSEHETPWPHRNDKIRTAVGTALIR